eukprot:scaffold61893_cov51-Phaeocystis_antarctica.AAC.8
MDRAAAAVKPLVAEPGLGPDPRGGCVPRLASYPHVDRRLTNALAADGQCLVHREWLRQAGAVHIRPEQSAACHLDGQRRRNWRLWGQLARAPEAVAGCPEVRPLPGSAELPRAARRALRRHESRKCTAQTAR